MIRRLLSRHTMAVTITAGVLTAGVGMAGVAGVVTLRPHAARGTALGANPPGNPYFLCLAYGQKWGICIGPPTT